MRLHPYTVGVRALSRGLGVGTAFAVFDALQRGSLPQVTGLLGTVGLLAVLFTLVEYARYERFSFDLEADRLVIRSGVLSRRDREIPFDRIQSVDLDQGVFARPLGLAVVRIETAGGGETEATLQYLGREEAATLREHIRQRRAGEGPLLPGDGADRRELFALERRELVLASVLSLSPGASALASVVAAAAGNSAEATPSDANTLLEWIAANPGRTAVLAAAVLLLAWSVSAALLFTRYYRFRLARDDEQLHYESGLLRRYSGSIPVRSVQRVTIADNPLKRAAGFVTIRLETAGTAGDGDAGGGDVTVPLLARERALALLDRVDGVAPEHLDVERPPARARTRYVFRGVLAVLILTGAGRAAVAVTGVTGPWYAVLGLVALAPVVGYLRWRHRGHATGEDHLVTRDGILRRRTHVVPYERLQTVQHRSTVFQRRRDLANVTADTASGAGFLGSAATAHDLSAPVAADLREHLLSAFVRSRDRPPS